jgi:peroxiredoxin
METASAEPSTRWIRRARRFVLELVVIVGAYLSISTCQTRRLIGADTAAPDFSMASLDGSTISLMDLRGKPVLVHFWATWCGVCRQELGALNAVFSDLGSDARLVSVVADSEDVDRLKRFVIEHDFEYPVLLGTPEVLAHYGVDTFPTNYFLDESGRVSARTIGMSNRWALKTRLSCAKR